MSANTGTKTVRDINKIFKYYKWSNPEKISVKKQLIISKSDVNITNQISTSIPNTSNTNQLSLGKTYKYNLNMSFIKLYYNNERVIFQTPMLFVPYAPRKGEFGNGTQSGDNGFKESYYLTASLFNDEYDPDVGEFETWINDLETQTLKLLRKRPYLNANSSGKTPILKFDDYRGCQKLNLKFERGNAKFYIIEGKSKLSKAVPFNEIVTPCYAVFIIELGGVWIKKHAVESADTEWGINFILHGAQCTPSHTEPSPLGIQPNDFIYNSGIANVCAKITTKNSMPPIFIPPPPPPPPPGILFGQPQQSIPSNPILVPYLKMLKLGIPRDAVKQKMMLAGDDPNLLDTPLSTSIPPCPVMPNFSAQSSALLIPSIPNSNPPKITSDMLVSVRLKKSDTDAHTPSQHGNKTSSQSQSGFKVNLSDILSMKSRLKSRNTNDDKDTYSKIFKKE